MYLSEPNEPEARAERNPLPYRESMDQADRGLFDEYTRACAGVRVLEVLRRMNPPDPVQFWEKVITWLPKLFRMKRLGEEAVRRGEMSRADFLRDLSLQMGHVYPAGYALGTEDQELARARCALAKARWIKQSRINPGRRATPGLQGFFGETRSAEEPIREGDFEKVLKVLAGPSPWQSFITPNLAIARKHMPFRPFRIVKYREFIDTMEALGDTGGTSNIPGVTDKRTGAITMQEWLGVNSQSTFLGAALHEAVHMVSAPAEQGRRTTIGYSIFGEGLSEGLTECITIDILRTQKISLTRDKWRGHVKRLKVAIALLLPLGVPMLGEVMFKAKFEPFMRLMHQTYSIEGWEKIKELTTKNKPEDAIQQMTYWKGRQKQQQQPAPARR